MSDTLLGLLDNSASARALAHARRTEFEFFMRKAAPELGIDLEDNWHLSAMYELANLIAEGDLPRGMVNVPPRALKSVIFSEVLPAWLLGREPSTKIICVSYNQGLAEDFARRTRKIMRAPWYRELFPDPPGGHQAYRSRDHGWRVPPRYFGRWSHHGHRR